MMDEDGIAPPLCGDQSHQRGLAALQGKHPVRTIFRERAVVPSFAV